MGFIIGQVKRMLKEYWGNNLGIPLKNPPSLEDIWKKVTEIDLNNPDEAKLKEQVERWLLKDDFTSAELKERISNLLGLLRWQYFKEKKISKKEALRVLDNIEKEWVNRVRGMGEKYKYYGQNFYLVKDVIEAS